MLLIAISCAWVLGIFLGSLYHLPLVLIFTGLIPVPLIFFFSKQRKLLVLMAISLATLFGAAFYSPTTVSLESRFIYFINQSTPEISGIIDSPPEMGDTHTHIELTVRETRINGSWQKDQGKILLFVPRYPVYQYGDILLVKGKLENPPKIENFDYQAYLAGQGIYSTMLNPQIKILAREAGFRPLGWIFSLRERLSQVLASALPEPQASLAQGIVLGIRSSIPALLRTNLAVSGTAHLLAISGINLTIIVGILVVLGLWIFGRRRYIYVWLALLIIWFYSLITGMQAPVIRSAIMASLFLFAELLGRQKSAFVVLAFSAAIMVGVTPRILWSVSFQLTFVAMVGLIFIAPVIQNMSRKLVNSALGEEGLGVKAITLVTDSFSITLGALIAVWPIIAYNFNIISFIGPLSTFLIAPVLSFIIVLGALTAIIGLISLPLAQVFGWLAWLFLSYMLWMVNTCAALPSASMNTGNINSNLIRTYYVLLSLAILLKTQLSKLVNRVPGLAVKLKEGIPKMMEIFAGVPKKWVVIPLLVIAFLTSFTAATMPDGDLHVSVLDVGEGDSIFIQNGYQNILIDGGPSPQAACLGLSAKMPFWDRHIDLLILTHPHLDHLSGMLEVIQRYKINRILAPNLISTSTAYQEWLNLVKTRNIQYSIAQSGQQIKLESGAILDILNPPDTLPGDSEADLENKGIVARLTLKAVSFLFTADVGPEAESRLISGRADLNCTVLKVAHHGSSTSTTAEFLAIAKPQLAAISVGSDNLFGHPDSKVITRLSHVLGSDQNIYRTDQSGTLEFTTDGRQLWVKTSLPSGDLATRKDLGRP